METWHKVYHLQSTETDCVKSAKTSSSPNTAAQKDGAFLKELN